MKFRSMMMLGAIAAASAVVAADTDVSGLASDTLGWIKVTSSAKSTIVSVPWIEVGSDADAVSVAKLVKTDTLTAGSQLLYWDGSKFLGWVLSDGAWTPSAVSYDNGKGGTATAQTPGSSYTLPRGKALFITRVNTSDDIYLYGKKGGAVSSFTIEAGTAEAPTYTLIGNPTTADVSLNKSGLFTTPGANDQIIIPGLDGSVEKQCEYKDGEWKWKKTGDTVTLPNGAPVSSTPWVTDGATIPLGRGVWYVSKGGSPTVQF